MVTHRFPPTFSYVLFNVFKMVLEGLEDVQRWVQLEASFPFCSGLLRCPIWNRLMVYSYVTTHVGIYHIYHITSSGKEKRLFGASQRLHRFDHA